jgi:SAM-dependent methyltransferase
LGKQSNAIVEMIGGQTFLAPIGSNSKNTKSLDIGCGTGHATLDLAQKFPTGQVYGLDISPVPEDTLKVSPSNVKFLLGNYLNLDLNNGTANSFAGAPGVFARGEFDFIFGRMLIMAINDWSKYFTTSLALLKPGAYIEHQDVDWVFYSQEGGKRVSDNWEWLQAVTAEAAVSGIDLSVGTNTAARMADAGLEVVEVKQFEFSFVPSEKAPESMTMGKYVQQLMVEIFPGLLRSILGKGGRFSSDTIERLVKECLSDSYSEQGIHLKYTVTVGKSPN